VITINKQDEETTYPNELAESIIDSSLTTIVPTSERIYFNDYTPLTQCFEAHAFSTFVFYIGSIFPFITTINDSKPLR